ncbi:MAG: cell division protein FtsI [Lachnospiraceae bacterium]|nr:cell division protein FtsI [Lachnospiraceae bacterium]
MKKDKSTQAKKQKIFARQMKGQLTIFYGIVVLLFLCLGARLVYITTTKEDEYKKTVLSQRKYDSKTIPYQRGSIVDAKGTTLAVSKKVYNAVLDSSIVEYYEKRGEDDGSYKRATADAISKCFGLDSGMLVSYMTDNPTGKYYVVAKQLDYEKVQEFNNLVTEADETEEATPIKGIWFEEEYLRYYPGGSLASDVIGYTNSGNSGAYGLEEFYNDVLNGTNGREYGYLNDDQNLERTTIPAIDGQTVVTTIDANIQRIVENKINDYCTEYENNYREGFACNNIGCIVMECDTGNVLAMASAPTWDLNEPRNVERYYTSEQMNKFREELKEEAIKKLPPNTVVINNGEADGTVMNTTEAESTVTEATENAESSGNTEDTETTDSGAVGTVNYVDAASLVSEADLNQYALAKLWSNYCVSATYEPGSVAKPFTVAMGLDSGKMNGNEHYYCKGYHEVGGYTIKCHNRNGDGDMSVANAIAQSCNVSLMMMGETIGQNTFLSYFSNFNFGLKTNVDITGEARTDSLVFNSASMGPTELATSTFGQGFNVTMIQMISAFNSLVNGGYYYEPHMVSKILSPEGSVVESIEPRILKQTVSASTSDRIVEYCNGVVTDGTGKNARPAGYSIGGKTGTAETAPRGTGDYVVSFMGYAPADNPKYLCYVVIDRPNMPDQTNGTRQAAVITREIYTEILPYLNVFMTEELSETEIAELTAKGLYDATLYRPEEEETDVNAETEETEVPAKPEMKIDPETGYGIDPLTGEYLDPETGYPINPESSFIVKDSNASEGE